MSLFISHYEFNTCYVEPVVKYSKTLRDDIVKVTSVCWARLVSVKLLLKMDFEHSSKYVTQLMGKDDSPLAGLSAESVKID